MTLDTRKTDITRACLTIFEILGKLGGISHIFAYMCSFFLAKYALIYFKVDTIRSIFKIKTKETEEDSNFEVNTFDRILLATGCCVKKRLKRMVDKGFRKLKKELDIVKIRHDILLLK